MEDQLTITHRPATARGQTEIGWLSSRHTFSFGGYQDAAHSGYRTLRVINDDRVAPGQGFGEHGHKHMEIFSYVIQGQLKHSDSMGNERVIEAGEFQYMSAGDGVRHSEFNPSDSQLVHFLQIWIEPAEVEGESGGGGQPLYADMDTKTLVQENSLVPIASPDGRAGSIAMRQNAMIHLGQLAAGHEQIVEQSADLPYVWVHVIAGQLVIGDVSLVPGDGAAIEGERFAIKSNEDARYLLFQLS